MSERDKECVLINRITASCLQAFAGGMETVPLVQSSLTRGAITCIRVAHFGVRKLLCVHCSMQQKMFICLTLNIPPYKPILLYIIFYPHSYYFMHEAWVWLRGKGGGEGRGGQLKTRRGNNAILSNVKSWRENSFHRGRGSGKFPPLPPWSFKG